MWLLLVVVAVFGLAIGSFLNVVIYRVPAGQSLVTPASHCPHCDAPVRNRHNVPVLGWLLLRGRCADCAAPISARYPLVEAVHRGGVRRGDLAAGRARPAGRPAGLAVLHLDRHRAGGDRPGLPPAAQRDRAALLPGAGGAAGRHRAGAAGLLAAAAGRDRGRGAVRRLLRAGAGLSQGNGLRRRETGRPGRRDAGLAELFRPCWSGHSRRSCSAGWPASWCSPAGGAPARRRCRSDPSCSPVWR